jgi:periplasmic protein TonB
MSIVRWAGAAAVVCSLHVGGVTLALMYWPEKEADDPVGAMTVELAPLPTAARVDTPNFAHGPLTPAVLPRQEATEKVQQEVVEDLPPVPPSPAPEPEIALPKPPLEEKQEEPEKEVPRFAAPAKERPADAAEEKIAAAPPRVEAPAAPAASMGQEPAVARLRARWYRGAFRHLERFKRYPEAARRRGQYGTVVVRVRVDRSGHVVSSQIVKGSGQPLLDEEVFALIKRSNPFPLPPDQVPESDLVLVGTINFK